MILSSVDRMWGKEHSRNVQPELGDEVGAGWSFVQKVLWEANLTALLPARLPEEVLV